MGSRWRHDVRCGYTGDIKDPEYKTWTHRQVWDLITLDGRAADPRDVEVDVEDPLGTADMRAVGAHYVPDALEWLEEQGKLLEEDEDPAPSPEDAAESALLASHFSGGWGAGFGDRRVRGGGADSSKNRWLCRCACPCTP